MNFRERLIEKLLEKKSILCVGIDPDTKSEYFPKFLHNYKKPKLEFAKMIIDEVHDSIAVIKLNTRFYFPDESDQLKSIIDYGHKYGLEIIGDCKENDIGHTMEIAYRKYFKYFNFDAITVNPYFGRDGVIGNDKLKIYEYWAKRGKGLFVLIKTSNDSSIEIQDIIIENPLKPNTKCFLYMYIAELIENWSSNYEYSIGGVVSAKSQEHLKNIRDILTGILLLPGFDFQGGKLENIKYITTKTKFNIINSSRGIMYAYKREYSGKYSENNFNKACRKKVDDLNFKIRKIISIF